MKTRSVEAPSLAYSTDCLYDVCPRGSPRNQLAVYCEAGRQASAALGDSFATTTHDRPPLLVDSELGNGQLPQEELLVRLRLVSRSPGGALQTERGGEPPRTAEGSVPDLRTASRALKPLRTRSRCRKCGVSAPSGSVTRLHAVSRGSLDTLCDQLLTPHPIVW
jgi:hypothetical protein